MNNNKMGGPAFPGEQGHTPTGNLNMTFHRGMTMLDYFAGQALAGYLAGTDNYVSPEEAAKESYDYADAMLAERAKRQEGQ